MKKDYPETMGMRISPEAIYAYVHILPRGELKKELLRALRHRRKRRHRQKGDSVEVNKPLEAMDDRPTEVLGREVPGHWKGDLLIGKNRQSALGSVVERKTRFLLLVRLKSKRSDEVRREFGKVMMKCPASLRRSLTYDLGREMAEHQLFTKQTRMQVYFAHPASPWERGTNENTNGLIRQYFPKGTDFKTVSAKEIRKVQDEINGRPRKCLDFMTPAEVF